MASSYAVSPPPAPFPHEHRNHHHMYSTTHSPTKPPSPVPSPQQSAFTMGPAASGSLHAHSQSDTHEKTQVAYGHARFQSHVGAPIRREKGGLPTPINIPAGWKEESTPGGRRVLTPSTASFLSPYQPPSANGGAGDGHPHKGHHHDDEHHHHHHTHPDENGTAHAHDSHEPQPAHGHGSSHKSAVTKFLLQYTAQWPLLHTIMSEKDSRRILYYLSLNVSFMMVQAFYGYVTDSLGLLSDTVHMFFDCVALFVGLAAAVLSKWPPSQRFPYGLGKMETLSGFANGILLVLLSVEITFEAFERLHEGSMPTRLGELFTVSTLGMLVNLVGVFAFGHHHHGHDHGHSHSHGHDHAHEHSDANGHDGHAHAHAHAHEHSHDNENMQGIYLHVLADTLGSLSVVVSTALTSVWGWAGWDPLASVFISILIILSSKPLIVSSARRLLLSIPDDTEYNLRNILAGIGEQRGVVGCAAPQFWIDDRGGSDSDHRLVGIVHVVAARGASLDEVRDGVHDFLLKNGIDVTVQVEREGEGGFWCGAGRPNQPFSPQPLSPLSKQL